MSNKASTQSERTITHYLFSTQRPLTIIPFPPERLQQAEELCERLNKMQKEELCERLNKMQKEELCERLNKMQKEEFWHIAK